MDGTFSTVISGSVTKKGDTEPVTEITIKHNGLDYASMVEIEGLVIGNLNTMLQWGRDEANKTATKSR